MPQQPQGGINKKKWLGHILAELYTALSQEVFALRCGATVTLQEVVGLVGLSRSVVACG